MKQLTKEQVQEVAKGCIQIKETEKGLSLYRFPDSILEACENHNEGRGIRGRCSVGIVLDFHTNAEELEVKCNVAATGARSYCYFDLWIDGIFADYAGTEEDGEETLELQFQLGPAGETRHIQLYLPHSREVFIESLSLSDDAEIKPTAAKPLLLAYGDSITQGMNGRHPSLIYSVVAARALDMDVMNAGVGGARFELMYLLDKLTDQASLITVAYGTNDWSNKQPVEDANTFLTKLRELYPDNPFYVLAPTWRVADAEPFKPESHYMPVAEYRAELGEIVSKLDNAQFIEKELLHPPGMELMRDGLHPDTDGQMVYGTNLATVLKRLG